MDIKTHRKIVLVGDRVLIIPDKNQERTEHGLYLPPGVKDREKVTGGTVVQAGPGYAIANPNYIDQEPWSTSPKEPVKYIPLQAEAGDMGRSAIWAVYRSLDEHSGGIRHIRGDCNTAFACTSVAHLRRNRIHHCRNRARIGLQGGRAQTSRRVKRQDRQCGVTLPVSSMQFNPRRGGTTLPGISPRRSRPCSPCPLRLRPGDTSCPPRRPRQTRPARSSRLNHSS